MKGFFAVVQNVKTWMRSVIPDPSDKIFTSQLFIVLGVIYLKQEGLPVTRQELLRATTLSTSSVHRGLSILIEYGILSRKDNFYDLVGAPKDITNITTCDSSLSKEWLDDLKGFIIGRLAKLGAPTEQLEELAKEVGEFDPKKERTGVQRILGDGQL